jgi:hypothetical protein
MKFDPLKLSIFWTMILKWVVISSYAEHARKLVGTRRLTMLVNWFLASWASKKIISAHHVHFEIFFSPVTLSSVSFFCPCLTSLVPSLTSLYFVSLSHNKTPVLCLCSLSPVLCPLSYISVPCLPSALPSLTSLSLYLVLYPLSHSSDLCLLSCNVPDSCDLFPVSHSSFSVP